MELRNLLNNNKQHQLHKSNKITTFQLEYKNPKAEKLQTPKLKIFFLKKKKRKRKKKKEQASLAAYVKFPSI
jgi:hypothetical protein